MGTLEKLQFAEPWDFLVMLLFGAASLLAGVGIGGGNARFLGHNLSCFRGLWWCRRCGGWTFRGNARRGLLISACRVAQRGSRAAIAAISRGQLPHASLRQWPDGARPTVVPEPKRRVNPKRGVRR